MITMLGVLEFSFSEQDIFIDHDPALNLKPPLFDSAPEFVSIKWEEKNHYR